MRPSLDWLDDALGDLDRRGLRRYLSRGAREVTEESIVNFSSNDYLGLAGDPEISVAVRAAMDDYGWGAGASPLVTGRSDLHAQLEHELAAFEGAQAALLFPTGYAANVGTIAALVGKEDAIYSDELNHASMIDGCRLSGAAIHIYPHSIAANDRSEDLEKLAHFLRGGRRFRRRLIVTESIFSMHGTLAPLKALVQLAKDHQAMLLIDEAHATGVFGQNGRGLCELEGVDQDVDIRVGTLSKALGSHGGFVVGSQKLIDWLANRARTYGFSTAPPPPVAAAGLAALDIVRKEPERRTRLRQLVIDFQNRLNQSHIAPFISASQIVPIVLGNPDRALAASAQLRRRGFLVPAIRPPSVPDGQSLLRISLASSHTAHQINSLVAALDDLLR
jgi:8-amino-7-oxononanoate synthase